MSDVIPSLWKDIITDAETGVTLSYNAPQPLPPIITHPAILTGEARRNKKRKQRDPTSIHYPASFRLEMVNYKLSDSSRTFAGTVRHFRAMEGVQLDFRPDEKTLRNWCDKVKEYSYYSIFLVFLVLIFFFFFFFLFSSYASFLLRFLPLMLLPLTLSSLRFFPLTLSSSSSLFLFRQRKRLLLVSFNLLIVK